MGTAVAFNDTDVPIREVVEKNYNKNNAYT